MRCLFPVFTLKRNNINRYENFHFNKAKSPSFEGFYFKCLSKDGSILVIICGYTKSKSDKHAFIQVSSSQGTSVNYFRYPFSDLKIKEGTFNFTIGSNSFSKHGIHIDEKNCKVNLNFERFEKWPRKRLNPGIMGLLGIIPLVECKHDVVAPEIIVHGNAEIENTTVECENGQGYIDKNWGQSFPKKYFWGHITGFKDSSISIQFAKGHPKWLFWNIPVYIGFIKINDEIHRFKSWEKGKMTLINVGQHELIIQNKEWEIKIVFEHDQSFELRAPKKGLLNDKITEYAGSKAVVTIYKYSRTHKEMLVKNEVVYGTTLEHRL